MKTQATSLMQIALDEAEKAYHKGEIPVGAVVVEPNFGKILAKTHNRVEETKDPTAHAELLAIRAATSFLGEKRLVNLDIYVTLEPCPMCAQAIAFTRFRRLYFGAYDPKGGGVEHGPKIYSHPTAHHKPEVIGGIREQDCAHLLKAFFEERR